MDETVRDRIRAWWSAVGPFDKSDLTLLTERAIAEFRSDRDFCDRFLDEYVRRVVVSLGAVALRTQSPMAHRELPTDESDEEGADPVEPVTPSRHVSGAELVSIMERQPSSTPVRTWRTWFEVDPVTGVKTALQHMTRDQLVAAARRRELEAHHNLRESAFLRLLAGRLDEGDVVRDKWSAGQLYALEENLEVERVRYSLRQIRRTLVAKGDAA